MEGEEEAVDVRYRNTRPGYVRIGKREYRRNITHGLERYRVGRGPGR